MVFWMLETCVMEWTVHIANVEEVCKKSFELIRKVFLSFWKVWMFARNKLFEIGLKFVSQFKGVDKRFWDIIMKTFIICVGVMIDF